MCIRDRLYTRAGAGVCLRDPLTGKAGVIFMELADGMALERSLNGERPCLLYTSYLLKDPKAKLRTTEDAKFMKAQTRYLEAVARVAEPFLVKNGGPIPVSYTHLDVYKRQV